MCKRTSGGGKTTSCYATSLQAMFSTVRSLNSRSVVQFNVRMQECLLFIVVVVVIVEFIVVVIVIVEFVSFRTIPWRNFSKWRLKIFWGGNHPPPYLRTLTAYPTPRLRGYPRNFFDQNDGKGCKRNYLDA